jgi:precorrin-6A/cobalt-precorrin-6A reductase
VILVLGGTAEARDLAGVLDSRGERLVSSLAGLVRAPALPPGEVRIGGFGGVSGLVAYLRTEDVRAVVDATHPFAARISANAAAACAAAGCRLLRLQRPGWRSDARSEAWTWVQTTAEVLDVAGPARRPFLTTGRQSLDTFLAWADRSVLARVVDPPAFAVPKAWRLLLSRGPYAYEAERRLMSEHGADLLVTKDSGGSHTAAKLEAATDLGIRVVVVARPEAPAGVECVPDVAAVLAWLDR